MNAMLFPLKCTHSLPILTKYPELTRFETTAFHSKQVPATSTLRRENFPVVEQN